jgi:F0F1-type ATP synthase assembly protein I
MKVLTFTLAARGQHEDHSRELTDRPAGAKNLDVVGSMKGMKAFGKYGGLGFELLGSIAVGYYLGVWLDKKAGTHWIAFVGFLLGCYAGFRALFRAAKKMQRDIELQERLDRGEDPWAPKSKDDDDDLHDGTEKKTNGDDARR